MSSSAPTPPEDGFPAGQTGDMRDVLLSPSSGTRPAAAPAGRWEPPSAEELQKLLPQYEITALLGRGGMGAVYKGRQIALDRPVAIKILSNQLDEADASFAERFKNEARALGKLSHPGIVGVYEFGEAQGGLLYIVMEFIDGTDVAKMIAKQGRLHTEHAMAITAHVCDALAYAHERGIIHRDIKPANIMVGYDGVVKVADFGLAKMTHTQNSGLTQSGMAMGTLHYMAPEALMLGSAVDHRADIYAVGVMLYQMLTGKIPQGLFELPSLQIPGLDPRYDSIIGKALREDRELRYPRVLDMRHDLDAILTQPVVKVEAAAAKPPAALETQARPQRPGGQPYRPPQPEVIVRTEKKGSPLLWVALIAMSGIAGWLVLNKDSGKSSEEPPSAPVSEAPVADDVNPSALTAGAPSATTSNAATATKEMPFVNSLGMKFVPVPGTNILMCVHETRKADYASYAAEKAGLNGFWKSPTYDGTPVSFADDHPVCNVSWQDCRDFCEWLNHKEGRTYRLPTDREWSFAVGIGEREDASLSPHLLSDRLAGEFPWGSQWPPPAGAGNLGDTTMASKFPKRRPIPGYTDGFATTAPVMSFSPNPFGLHDLAGNVWEFCEDWYDETQTKRVIRGLNFDDGGENSVRFLSSHRGWCPVGNRHSNFGFRVVLDTAARPVDKASVTPAVIAPPQTAEETGFMPLLDTTHTDGWQTVSKGSAGDVELADGVLTLKPNQNWPGYHWYVKQSFGDFTLRLQYKLGARSGNSGVPVRVELPSQMPRQHYEVDVSNSSNPMEASGAIMFIKPPTARAQKDDDWNDLEITADGQNYRILINGVVVNEFIGNKSTRGHIGLQIGVSTVQYRNIRIKELTPPVPPASVVSVTLPTGPTNWTDTKGRSITATFKAIASGNLLLDIAGKVTPVPLNTLSAESQKLARDYQQAAMTTTFPDNATKEVPFINTLGMKFVPVPGTKSLFCIHETRRQDYGAFAAANPGADSAWKNALESGVPVGDQEGHPVVNVSWNEAQTFCAWLSTKEGRAYRLPTDREWSAAVGLANREPTGMTPEQLKLLPQNANHFPWGTTWPPPKDAGNFSDTTASAMLPPDVRASSIEGYTDGFATTAPVMSFTPNRLGLYDLGGNVFEMVQDLIDPTWTEYVVRGHSYAGGTRAALLSSNRGTCSPHAQITRHGFRVVLSVAPATTAVPMPSPSAIVPPSPRAPSGTSTPATTKDTPFINTLGMKFVPVPGTKVLFSIWETRVRDYSVFARSNKVDDSWTNRQRNGIPVARDRDHPVVAVNWEEAQAFCRWLTDEETTAGKLTKGWLYRLPKDEEWSAAVGLTSEQGTTPSQKGARSQEHYPWGGAFPPPAAKIGNYADSSWHDAFPNDLWMNGYTDGFPTTAPVGSFPANLHGIHDLGGNVWEWCEDLLTPQVTKRVLRGGSWGNSSRDDLRSACRYFFGEPENRAHAYGFRCVLELPQP